MNTEERLTCVYILLENDEKGLQLNLLTSACAVPIHEMRLHDSSATQRYKVRCVSNQSRANHAMRVCQRGKKFSRLLDGLAGFRSGISAVLTKAAKVT